MKTKFTKSLLLAAILSTGLAMADECPLCEPAFHNNLAEIRRLLNNGADVNATGENGSVLMGAVVAGHAHIVRELLKSGANTEATAHGLTPLMVASRIGYLAVVKELLKSGAKVNAMTDEGATALWVALWYDHDDIAALLLANGADVDLVEAYYLRIQESIN